MEQAGTSMYSLGSRASFASSRQSKLTSLASSVSMAAPSFTSLNRPEEVSVTLSELYKKHGTVSSAAHAYKKLIRQRTQDTNLTELDEAEDQGGEEASSAAVQATQALMTQLTCEVEKATHIAARQVTHLRETQLGLDSMHDQLEMMIKVWSRTLMVPAQKQAADDRTS